MTQAIVYVAAVVRQDHRILLVRQAAGHPLEGQWTVPWGRTEHGESPMSAAVRETWEEGGIRAQVEGLLGVQELPSPQEGCVAIVYLCRHVSGTPEPNDRETDAARYFSVSGLDALTEPMEPWSDWLIRRVFAGEITVTYADPLNPLQKHGAFL
jgi:ADP-ribose pyrophosphatase YjhB (NUDIX family)